MPWKIQTSGSLELFRLQFPSAKQMKLDPKFCPRCLVEYLSRCKATGGQHKLEKSTPGLQCIHLGDGFITGWWLVVEPPTPKNDGVSSSVGMIIYSIPNFSWKVIKIMETKPPTSFIMLTYVYICVLEPWSRISRLSHQGDPKKHLTSLD